MKKQFQFIIALFNILAGFLPPINWLSIVCLFVGGFLLGNLIASFNED